MMLNFNVSIEDGARINDIVLRAEAVAANHGMSMERLRLTMDLCLAHNLCPLWLEGLLAAEERDFIHDVFGIRRYLNRVTGTLQECFIPRYAASNHPEGSRGAVA